MNFKDSVRLIAFSSLIAFGLLNSSRTVADNTDSIQTAAPSPVMTTVLPLKAAEGLFKFYYNGDEIFGKQDRHHRLKETFWTPTAADVAQAELALADYARTNPNSPFMISPKVFALSGYFRQYAGVMRGGEKRVLINCYVVSNVSHSPIERNYAVLVCDGGFLFFHALYNPITHKIETLEFNGIG